MYQESLSNYKQQVYNPGSPHPCPTTVPFQIFPKKPTFCETTIDPINPLKLTFSNKKRKRNSTCDSDLISKSPKKKPKMMSKEETNVFFESFFEKQEQLNAGMRDDMGAIKHELVGMRQSQDRAALAALEEKEATKARFEALESRLDNLETKPAENVNPATIKDAVRQYADKHADKSSDSAWKANLTREVFEHEHGLVIHGVKLEGTDDGTRKDFMKNFFKTEMKASTDIGNICNDFLFAWGSAIF